jgi:hypothetical protein
MGIAGLGDLSPEEVERAFKITRERIRRIEERAKRNRCRVVLRFIDEDGRLIKEIDTSSPDGVKSTDGSTMFEVLSDQVVEISA